MSKSYIYLLLIILCLSGCLGETPEDVIRIKPDQTTLLIPRQGMLNGGITQFMPDEPFKVFWVENWKSTEQSIQWHIAAKKDSYLFTALVHPQNLKAGESVILELSDGKQTSLCKVLENGWQRCQFEDPLSLSEGNSTLTLKIAAGSSGDSDLQLYSLEVTQTQAYEELQERVKELRSDASWMGDIRYGFFFHWNSRSMPLEGEQKSYEQAVRDFNVEQFAHTVNDCGGKLVFFTTSWAEYYFPAPIRAIDRILPGRTASRDLVADLSEALGKYDIRLILYYHAGHGDPEWWEKQHFNKEDPGDLFTNIEEILGEVSMRYKEKLAGFWIDDGIGYYPNGAPFEKITRAAKSGNKNGLICYNPWILPRFTDFQDYYAGEVGLSVESAGKENRWLPIGGNGIFTGGPQQGLQATYTGLLEPGEWTHIYKNQAIDPPSFAAGELTTIIQESNKRKNLPMINIRVYQDGTISPQAYELMKQVKSNLGVQ